MSKPIATFYADYMNADMPNEKSPGIWKARELMKLVTCEPECALRHDFEKVTAAELRVVHSDSYVDGVLSLGIVNGHGNRREDVLNAILWQNGSFLGAVDHALRTKSIAFSPTSGFHHAGRDYGGGFCTFNALMLAAKTYQNANPGKDALIIDGDTHFGDGCVDINKDVGAKYITASMFYTPELFMERIENSLRVHDGLVMYQAGADCHKDDLYMSGKYTTEEMKRRDRLVFQMCKDRGLPVVWNLAGGYGAPTMHDTIRLHYNTWRIAAEVYCS